MVLYGARRTCRGLIRKERIKLNKVEVRQQTVTIPTYEPAAPCKHPMFLENRVYQGSSGRVYPHPVSESVNEEKHDREYNAIFLENDYLSVMILPELGGKIQRIYDKVNGRDAVYYNEVIKPALIGLAGPWTSGGIEFSWPQNHKASAYDRVDVKIEEGDGYVTVWCGEIEKTTHLKGMAGYTLYPNRAYLEVKGRLYNPTDLPKTFSWWANIAVPVTDTMKVVMPPDVHAVSGRDRRCVSKFPMATGKYYDLDLTEGVDISVLGDIKRPMSYAAYDSEHRFFGSYDSAENAGILHIADRNAAPGKQIWTWGNGGYGKAWEHNLTDSNGPYAELMAGIFTGSSMDFTYIMPYEEKRFKQYFMPYTNIGDVKAATTEIVVNLEVEDGKARIRLYAPKTTEISVILSGSAAVSYMIETTELGPGITYDKTVELEEDEQRENVKLVIKSKTGREILRYRPEKEFDGKLPKSVKAVKQPKEISSMEELYFTATHIEQYRHPTRRPEDYYLEGLRRDPLDSRMNNGYGKLLYEKGLFEEAEKRFRSAIDRMTMLNPDPYNCEPFYNLGLALKMQKRYKEAYNAFYRAVWDGKMQERGYYQLACVSAKLNDFTLALEFVNKSLASGAHNMRARMLKCALLRRAGRTEEAVEFAKQSLIIDPLDFGSRYELFRLTNDFAYINELTTLMHGDLENYIDLSIGYAEANLFEEASNVLALIAEAEKPMLHYYMAYYAASDVELEIAKDCEKDSTFPNRIQEIHVLRYAIEHNSEDWFSRYCLGNLYYDKGVWFKAVKCWKSALEIDPNNSMVLRNLAVATYNKLSDSEEAMRLMSRAAMFAPEDPRIYFELDRLRKLTNYPVKKRLKDMADNIALVESRDDLMTEYVALMNMGKYYSHALKAIKRHHFTPREGAEGRIGIQYKEAHMGCARMCIYKEDYEGAIAHLNEALTYPENLGEGRLDGSDNDIYYLMGCAYEKVDKITAIEYFKRATEGELSPASAANYTEPRPELYFYRTMAYRKLGDERAAISGFNTMINYCEEHIDDKPQIDYFAIALPEFDVFDGDLERENFVHCCFVAALGYTGKGMKEKAAEYIERGLDADCSHQGLIALRDKDVIPKEEKKEDTTVLRAAKWTAKA